MRVLILFCEEGDGHATAARVLARELRDAGAEPVVEDAMRRGLGRLIPLLSRDAYHLQVRRLRWTYGLEYWFFTQFPPGRRFARRGLVLFGARPLQRVIREAAPDLVVSTHPAVTNILGHLRRRGRLGIPAVATVTDFGVHQLWAHPGVDLHLVMHDAVVPAVARVAGHGRAAVVAPLVAPEFARGRSREEARRTLGLPPDRPLVLVSGGGWGVGGLETPATGALALPGVTVVCLTGRNGLLRRRLERRFAGEERLHVVPFTDRMPEYLAAADVLVDASLGVTCLEALQAGCRVVACCAPPGHSRDNARALARLGLAEVAGSAAELTGVLRRLLAAAGEPVALPAAPPAAPAVLAARALAFERPRRRRRRAAVATLAAACAALVLAGWTFASPTPYPVVARVLDLETLTHVATSRPEVGVVVLAPYDRIPSLALDLERRRIRVSFAVDRPLPLAEQRLVQSAGDGLVPVLAPAGARGVLQARTRLLRLRRSLRLGGRFYYLAPPGFTLSDYLVARAAGGLPFAGSARWIRGSVVVVDARAGYGSRAVAGLASSLARDGVRAVPLPELLTAAAGATRASMSAPIPVAASPIAIPRSRAGE